MKKTLILVSFIVVAVIVYSLSVYPNEKNLPQVEVEIPVEQTQNPPEIITPNEIVETDLPGQLDEPKETDGDNNSLFRTITLNSDKPGSELTKIVGIKNVFTVLAINRVDDKHLYSGMTVVIPQSFDKPEIWEFMPSNIESAKKIPKLVIISQRTQAFGFYEYGKLVRSGPVSSGKQTTPTKNGLYFTNWKGKEVVSTFSDEWILKWNFNIDNKEGISLHQYILPGYPASHSCVRMYEQDAQWLYDWANQWVLDSDGQTKLVNGTPVIIFGKYDFKKDAPWKKLPENPDATKVSVSEVDDIVFENIATIQKEQTK